MSNYLMMMIFQRRKINLPKVSQCQRSPKERKMLNNLRTLTLKVFLPHPSLWRKILTTNLQSAILLSTVATSNIMSVEEIVKVSGRASAVLTISFCFTKL